MLMPEARREALKLRLLVRLQSLQGYRDRAMVFEQLHEKSRLDGSEQCIEWHGACLLSPIVGALPVDLADEALPLCAAVFRGIAALAHPLCRLADDVVVYRRHRGVELTRDQFQFAGALQAVHP